ncbi:hypothetical protein B488_08660 [Liberibacter crescens BT-1]|uniref:Uncharacterized protein n=1 Tax=Liberibacter crescens (strain BT-1) TaxID=1215343 RepID=L0EW11_LIBCB|nr:hypothetical protein [Liberibacter crescens]AGA64858.1 hypothetical protein B488_08660 [Liberibacter crescens BT-1]
MNLFDAPAVCASFPISSFIIFIILYTIVCASIINSWNNGYNRPLLDWIVSIAYGLMMSSLIILFFVILKDQNYYSAWNSIFSQ